jgi:Tol biopolymer transport system component
VPSGLRFALLEITGGRYFCKGGDPAIPQKREPMKTKSALWTAIVVVACAGARATAEPARYMRHPALSPDRASVAFSYRGDIWRVAAAGGRAERLTVHPARDYRPVWSPDGRQIAFASDRDGETDIYLMPASGGPARRLTYQSGGDFPCDWSPDGRFILAEQTTLGRPDLTEVPVDGGAPQPVTGVPMEGEYFGRYSPDGKRIVFCDGGGYSRWWWEGNKSSRAGQVWTLERGSWPPKVARVSPEGAQFLWPGFAGDRIVCTGNQGKAANVVRLPAKGGDPVPVTSFADFGVRWLRTSNDGAAAVFERDMGLWFFDLATDSVRAIEVEAPSDWIASPAVFESVDGKVEEFALSHDGRKIAFIAGGELYLMPASEPKRARRLTHTDARERSCIFSPEDKRIAYVSDRTGRQNLYVVDTKDGAETALTQLADADVAKPQWAPGGEEIAFYIDNNRLARVPAGSGKIDTLLLGRYFDFPLEPTQEFRFSPDGRYLAYTAFGADYNSDVWIYALDGSRNENATRWSHANSAPRWSPDGRYLAFVHSHMDRSELYALKLERGPAEFVEARLDSLYEPEPAKKPEREKDERPTVTIDFAEIATRWERILPMAAAQTEPVQTPDGKYWVFLVDLPGGVNVWKAPVRADADSKPEQLTRGEKAKRGIVVSPDSKTVYYLEGGRIGQVGLDGKDAATLKFAADYDYRTAARYEQKLGEVWRMLGNYFYDRDLHGSDWNGLYAYYARALPHIALEEEFRELAREFIGHLNASHLDVYGNREGSSGPASGYLGAAFDPRALTRGAYVISQIHAGGPLDLPEVGVAAGDTIVAVNGVSLASAPLDSLLIGTVDRRTMLGVRRDGERTVAVKPVSRSAASDLDYEDWVATRRKLVDSLSGGRLGYLHVRAMNQPALDRFQRELTDQTTHYEGLIVDVRYNGGGWIAVHLLGTLERQPFVLRNFRGADAVSENKTRAYAVEKPMILLINHYSASNAEIFAEGWRRLGLGKIVGYPTSAAVIGTAEYGLIDGTFCRRPSWGAFTVDMENLEGNGRKPDIAVFNTLADWNAGRDMQLERAVTEMLTELR